jgi:hypothetical protein
MQGPNTFDVEAHNEHKCNELEDGEPVRGQMRKDLTNVSSEQNGVDG